MYDPFFNPTGGAGEEGDLQELLYNMFLKRQGGFRGVRGAGTDIVGAGGAAFGTDNDVRQIAGGGLISGFIPDFGVNRVREYRQRIIKAPEAAGGGGGGGAAPYSGPLIKGLTPEEIMRRKGLKRKPNKVRPGMPGYPGYNPGSAPSVPDENPYNMEAY